MVPIGRADRSGELPVDGPLAGLTAHMTPHGPAAQAVARILRPTSESASENPPDGNDPLDTLPAGLRDVCAILAEASARPSPSEQPDPSEQADRPKQADRSDSSERSGSTGQPGELVDALREHSCLVVSPAGVQASADALAAAIGDGKHTVVSGAEPAKLEKVRAALPRPLHALCLDGPLPLSEDEQRELRALLLTQTPARRARADQGFPDESAIPGIARLTPLCQAVNGPADDARDSLELVPRLLNELSPTRFTELAVTARSCREALRALDAVGISSWSRPLMQRVLFGPDRAEFTALMADAQKVANAADTLHGAGYRMGLVGPPPPDAVERLSTYIRYLEANGRARRYFAPTEQRAVTPLLHQLGLDRQASQDLEILRQALAFLELTHTMRLVSSRCERLRVPVPKLVPAAVGRRHRELERVERAIRVVEALRHEVLFIHPTSPISVPDLDTAEHAAHALIAAAQALPPARGELSEIAQQLDASTPEQGRAPEVADLIAAVRAGELADFRTALDRLTTARREQVDQRRQDELFTRLRAGAPRLADAWEEPDTHRYTQGTARFIPLDELLAVVPADDTADVLILLDGHTLQPESLVASAVAKQLVVTSGALVGSQRRATAGAPRQRPTAAALLSQAGAPVVTAPTSRPVTVPFQRLESPDGNRSDAQAGGSLFATGETASTDTSAGTDGTDQTEDGA